MHILEGVIEERLLLYQKLVTMQEKLGNLSPKLGERYKYIEAGMIGHRIYIASEYLGLGCSGIGAYYDLEAAKFLNTSNNILYVLTVG